MSSDGERDGSADAVTSVALSAPPPLRVAAAVSSCKPLVEKHATLSATACERSDGNSVEEPTQREEDRDGADAGAYGEKLLLAAHGDATPECAHTTVASTGTVVPLTIAIPMLCADRGAVATTHATTAARNAAADEPIDEQPPSDADDASDSEAQRVLELRAREMELFEQQLEKEMLKRRPDHFIIGVICRSLGGVPDHMRASVWKELLGVTRSERVFLDQSILQVEEDLENQKVISADACRTRGHDAFFRRPETVELVAKLLTYYCKVRNIRYKQGMNEVLAPFLLLERLPEGVVFQCFYALIDKFLPHVFADREFKSLQCSFQLYRLLLLYHDPMLCHYLDQHDMTPELYVTPWFMTLFARGLEPVLVFQLWDFFLLEEHPFLLHFVAYALVASHRREILSADVAMLPQVLASITFRSRAELEAICERALQLAHVTPRSFERDLYAVCYGGYSDASAPFLRHVSGASSLQVYPDELVANLLQRISAKAQSRASEPKSKTPSIADSLNPLLSPLSRSSSFSTERTASASSVFFIVLDCRPIEQYRECHLSLSYHIDPEVVGSPDALTVLLKGFARMKGCHFCFVGPSDPAAFAASTASKASTLALDTISRLARGISGERKPPIDSATSVPAAASSAALMLPASPGVPGAGANDMISREGVASAGPRKLHYEHISVTRLVLMFLQKGFEHISRLDGGFDELKREILAMDAFTQEQLLVHAEPPPSTTTSSSSGFKLFSKIGLTRLRSANSEDNIVVSGDTSSVPPQLNPLTGNGSGGAQLSITSSSDASVRLRPKPSTLSQRFQSFTSAVSQGATSVVVRARSSSDHSPSVPESDLAGTDERQLVGEDEWVEVCLRTQEALEKSLAYKDVVFQTGSMGILLQKAVASKKFHAVVDSIVPESQASESQQMQRGDLLVAVNGQSMESVPFLSVVELVKDAKRPVVLRFQNANAKQALESFDALAIPPMAPTLVSASHHAIGITWSKLSLPDVRYHVQYARQSEFHFNPWLSVTMKRADGDSSVLSTSGITHHTNGTLVGLDPGESFVFRVRCGNGAKWGPYSLSSNPISTLERTGDAEDEAERDDSLSSGVTSDVDASTAMTTDVDRDHQAPQGRKVEPVFLPGSCPVFVEHGRFYYRVAISLRARRRPAFDAEKLERVLDKGDVVECTTRMVAPGTNQIFVRLARDDVGVDVSDIAPADDGLTVKRRDSDDDDDDDDVGVWAFENTPEGTVVLERLSEPIDAAKAPTAAMIPLQEHTKSVVSAIFSAGGGGSSSGGSGSKSTGGASTSSTTSMTVSSRSPDDTDVFTSLAARVLMPPVAPRILQVFPVSATSIVVTWDPINDVGVTKYQIQYSKNRLAAMWWSVNQEIAADSLKFTVSELLPSTAYLFRIRGYNEASGWTPYSDASESCKTLGVDEAISGSSSGEAAKSNKTAKVFETDDKSDHADLSSAPASRTASGNSFRLPVGSIFSTPSTSSAATTSSSTASTSSGPLRTGSTFLDKAVAAASRLTLSRRRSLSSSSSAVLTTAAAPPSTSGASSSATGDESDEHEPPVNNGVIDSDIQEDQIIEEESGVTLVNLGHWKKDTSGAFEDFRFFAAIQYARRTVTSDVSGESEGTSAATVATDASISPAIAGATSPVATGTNLDKVGERDLVVTPTSLFVLNAWATSREGFAVLEHSRMLESLVKITAHRSVANLIVLHFKSESFSEPADPRRASLPPASTSSSVTTATECNASREQTNVALGSSSAPATEQLYFVVRDPDACVALVRQYFEQLMS